MTDSSARLDLPMLAAGQAQKEVTHNEALVRLDVLVQASVVGVGMDAPPAAPEAGQAWVVGDSPSEAWAGHPGALAGWTAGGWRFVAPFEGLGVWNAAAGVVARYVDGAWRTGELRARALLVDGVPVVGRRRAAIPDPSGGASVDSEARTAIAAILDALREHGLIAR